MRVSRATLESHRDAMLAAAGRLFRGRGIAGVSVADITGAAGLTHGAFYGHYPSKSALAEATCRASLTASAERWRARAAAARSRGDCGVQEMIDDYLSAAHCANLERGCTVPALAAELTRTEPALHAALSDGVAGLIDVLADEIALRNPDAGPERCRLAALAVMSALTGGLVLARAAVDPDRTQATLAAAAAAARLAADI